MAPSGNTTLGGSWAHVLPGPRSRLGTQHCLVLFWEVGASSVPVQEAAGLTSGSPGRPHAPGHCTAQSGWRSDQETRKPSSVPAKRRLGQSAWKQPRRPVGKQKQGPETVLLQQSSGNGPRGFLDQRGQGHVALAHPCASEPAMEASTSKYF